MRCKYLVNKTSIFFYVIIVKLFPLSFFSIIKITLVYCMFPRYATKLINIKNNFVEIKVKKYVSVTVKKKIKKNW